MSRRSDANEEYLRASQHEADGNIPGLISDLDSEEKLVRNHAARVLARLGATEAAPQIAKLTDDPAKSTRMTAYMALGKLGAQGVLETLLRGLHDPVAVVRNGAADGLGDLGDPSAIPRLHEVLATDRNREVRFCAAEALVKLGDKEVLKDLPQVLRAAPLMMHFGSRWKELKKVAESQGT